jgi:hypothetical protein
MNGVVDDSGRAILPIKILCPKYPMGVQIDTWIDTGTGISIAAGSYRGSLDDQRIRQSSIAPKLQLSNY